MVLGEETGFSTEELVGEGWGVVGVVNGVVTVGEG